MDASESLGVASITPLTVKGEAYRIERDIKFPQVSDQLDVPAWTLQRCA
jgi:hypothetical protein